MKRARLNVAAAVFLGPASRGRRTTAAASAAFATLVLGATPAALAQEPLVPTESSSIYYGIGGNNALSAPLNPDAAPPAVGVPAPRPMICDIFDGRHNDPGVALDMVSEHLEQELDALLAQAILAVQNIPSIIVVAEIQKAFPGLYDYSQNFRALLDLEVDFAKRTCEQQVAHTESGGHPFSGWVRVEGAEQWRRWISPDFGIAEDGKLDERSHVLAARRSITETAGTTGLRWYGGVEAGASNEEPINLVADVVSAGYASASSAAFAGEAVAAPATFALSRLGAAAAEDMSGDEDDGEGAAAGTGTTRLSELWPSSIDAAAFATEVLGEEVIAYCPEGCDGSVTPGRGLKPNYIREYNALVDEWTQLLRDYGTPGGNRALPSRLARVSGEQAVVTPKTFDVLIDLERRERDLYVYRFVSEVALERTVEKALALRELLRLGRRIPEVQSYEIAKERIDNLIASVREDVESFTWEMAVVKDLVPNTAGTLLAYQELRNRAPAANGIAESVPAARTVFDRGRPRVIEGATAEELAGGDGGGDDEGS